MCLVLCRTLTKVLGFPVVAPREWGGYFRNDAEHRDFVLIGTAAGLASAFSTPIGGLLLAVEQAGMLWGHMAELLCHDSVSRPPILTTKCASLNTIQGSSFLTIGLFWRGFLATCTTTVVLHFLAFLKVSAYTV
jgi:Voltage gated chloride channel